MGTSFIVSTSTPHTLSINNMVRTELPIPLPDGITTGVETRICGIEISGNHTGGLVIFGSSCDGEVRMDERKEYEHAEF